MDSTTPGSPSSSSAALGDDGSVLSTEVLAGSGSASPAAPVSTSRPYADRHLHDVGVAILSALSQYPHALNHESRLVTEIVHAMTESNTVSPHSVPIPGTVGNSSATPNSNPLGSEGSSSVSQTPEGDVNMEAIVQELIEHTASWQHSVTIADDSDNDDPQKSMVMDYDLAVMENHPPSSLGRDDELEDFIRFFPDEEDNYNRRTQQRTLGAEPNEADLDDFYRHVSYENADFGLPQSPPIQNPFESVDFGLEGPGPHPSITHRTSMPPFFFSFRPADSWFRSQ